MKALRTALVLAALTAAPVLAPAQGQGTTQNPPPGNPGSASALGALKVLSPASGQVLHQNFVTVKYELSNAGITGGSPHFRLRLDDGDPVTTTFTEYTFTSLRPGAHTLSVELVDANDIPIGGVRNEVRFNVVRPQSAPPPGMSVAPENVQEASLGAGDDGLPAASSVLPLLSVIGFGALLGGIASAMKTR
jgi:hypothetical protein